MNSSELVHTNVSARQELCRGWLVSHGIVFKELAASAGISKHTLSNIISGYRAPLAHIQKLIALGVPAELLPTPCAPRKRGPKPKITSAGTTPLDDDVSQTGEAGPVSVLGPPATTAPDFEPVLSEQCLGRRQSQKALVEQSETVGLGQPRHKNC